jgi:trk system potassium uptake protein TrkA
MNLIVVGCGRLGAELADRMARDGEDVVVIDKNPQAFYRLGTGFRGKTLQGVGFDRDVLVQAGIERSDALAAVTSGDNSNIITARIARMVFHVPKVVARIYDPRRAEIYQRLGLSTISSTIWGVNRVVQLLSHRDLNVIASLGNGEVDLVEVDVPHHWVSRTVNQVTVPGEVTISAINRSGRTFLPTLGTAFEEGDVLVIGVLASSRNQLQRLLAVG